MTIVVLASGKTLYVRFVVLSETYILLDESHASPHGADIPVPTVVMAPLGKTLRTTPQPRLAMYRLLIESKVS